MTLSPARRRGTVAAALVLAALLVAPVGPTAAADWTGRYSVWHNGAFATQYLDASCVGASIQMMLNLVRDAHDHSKGRQLSYLAYAAAQSKYPVTDGGADPEGWAEALKHYDPSTDWGWTNQATMQAALHTAAKQMRETGDPVGLLVHFGRHAWVMSGFEATADPQTTNDFTVTAAEVVGPLWPLGTLNGEHFDPGPQTWLDSGELARKFNEYIEPDQTAWRGQYVIVVPRASEANQGGGVPDQAADLQTVNGFIYIYDQLARSTAVRDFLWRP